MPSAKDVSVDTEYLKVFSVGESGCFARNTPVLLSNGSIALVQDITIGDKLMGNDGTARTVLSLCRGTEQMYRIKYLNGTYYDVNESHILSMHLQTHQSRTTVNMTVKEYLKQTKNRQKVLKLYKASIELPEYPVLIPPYIMGLWLGDGTTGKPELTNIDTTLIGLWQLYGESIGLSMTNSDTSPYLYRLTVGRTGGLVENIFTSALKYYDLMEKKRIPKEYIFTSKKNRLELIAGLLDTDGHLDQRGKRCFEISFKDEDMAEDFLFLCQSVGLNASKREVVKAAVTSKGRVYGRYYLISVTRNVEIIPTQLDRKKPIVTGREQRNELNFGFTVEKLDVDNYYGFEIDGNHLFLLADFSVVHNTGKSIFAASFPTPGFVFDFGKEIISYRGKDFDYEQYPVSAQGWAKYEKDMIEVRKAVTEGKYKTVVVDNLSAMTDVCMEKSMQLDPKRDPTGGPLWNVHYKMVKNLMEGKLRQLINLPCNIVFIAHLDVVKDDSGAAIGVAPSLTGSLSNDIPSYFDEVYYHSTRKEGSETKWLVQTIPVGRNRGRSRLSGKERLLPDFIENDYETIMKILKDKIQKPTT